MSAKLYTGLLACLFWVGCTTAPSTLIDQYPIIPQPQELVYAEHTFELPSSLRIHAAPELANEAGLLESWLKAYDHFDQVNLGLPPEESDIQLLLDPQLQGQEAYQLQIDPQGIRISGSTPAGVFYGVRTLQQILESPLLNEEKAIRLVGVDVKDEPAFQHRGMLLDCCRHFMEPEFVKRYIDLLSYYKMNVLHWHLTEDQGWRIEIDAYPQLTEVGALRTEADGSTYGGFYTKEQIREIVAYAANRHILVIPEIELPGHSTAAIAAYPWLSCRGEQIPVQHEWGVFQDIYCAGKDSTFVFLETVLGEVMELFPSPYIHIGGDEAPKTRWESCSHCQQRIADEGLLDEHELQSWFIEEIGEFLSAHDRQLIGWDEILEGGIPEGAIIQSWRGMEGGIAAAQSGHEVIMSPTSHAYFDYGVKSTDLEEVYHFNPIPAELQNDKAKFIRGGECNMWTEHAPQELVDSKMFPRLLAMAAVLWTQADQKDYPDFYQRVQQHYPILDSRGVDYGLETVPVEVHGEIVENELFIHAKPRIPGVSTCLIQGGECMDVPEDGVQVEGAKKLEFKVSRYEKPYGDPVVVEVHNHDALGLPVELASAYSPYYTGGGDHALTDGFLGSMDFRDGRWQALQEHDMIATVDLGDVHEVTGTEANFYFYNNAWIFFPTEVEFLVSQDGIRWEHFATVEVNVDPKDEEQAILHFGAKGLSASGRYVRMHAKNIGFTPEWHDAPGEPAWLFCDEFVVITE